MSPSAPMPNRRSHSPWTSRTSEPSKTFLRLSMMMKSFPAPWYLSNVIIIGVAPSADLAGQVGPGPGVLRVGEDLGGRAVLDELAEVEEDDVVGDAPGLAEDVGDDDDRVIALELDELPLDVLARLGVEGRGRLVAEDDLGLDGQAPGQAQPLLLADREARGRVVEPVLDLVPQARRDQVVAGR